MSPMSFVDWLEGFIDGIGAKPTVAQWNVILNKFEKVIFKDPEDCVGQIGFVLDSEESDLEDKRRK